jgi:GNAT superfamily N-acetyltransferase
MVTSDPRTPPIDHGLLVDALAEAPLLLPELPGMIEFLTIPGVRGRLTPLAHPLANAVGLARLRADEVEPTVQALKHLFGGQQKAFSWSVGPRDTPADLGERLVAAGLQRVIEYAGLAWTDLGRPVMANPAVRVEELSGDAWRATNAMRAAAFGVPVAFMDGSAEALIRGQDRLRTRFYVAHVPEAAEPVAFSQMMYFPGRPIVSLGGAATLPGYRGRGVYTSLVARRLADARAEGIQAAVIQAMRQTSAPICQRLGFVELCRFDVYTWSPGAD